jgi:hypothetical protein
MVDAMTQVGACKFSLRRVYFQYHQYANISTVAFYAGLNLIAWFMIFCFVRETKQLTLEEIDRKCQSTH